MDGLIGEECYLQTSVEVTKEDKGYVLTKTSSENNVPLSL